MKVNSIIGLADIENDGDMARFYKITSISGLNVTITPPLITEQGVTNPAQGFSVVPESSVFDGITGTGSPTALQPQFLFQEYIDTASGDIYKAFGLLVGNWKLIS
jgi:hypothetical protein